MGREVRMVPPNWVHPQYRHEYTGEMRDQPMHDEHYDDALAAWLADFDRIRANGVPDDEKEYYPRGLGDWFKDYPPPDPDMYRPWRDEEATWFQVWQTVSEGSPVSPPFATEEELIDYLAANGDFWDQKNCRDPSTMRLYGMEYGKSGWGREAAERFVKGKWAPSLIVTDGHVIDGKLAM